MRSSYVLFALLLLAGCAARPHVTIETAQGPITVFVEIADEPAEHAQGLMGRTTLAESAGMLFMFPDEQPRAFWMKNTLIPLDILYMDHAGTVIDIQTMTPCTTDRCPAYPSAAPARYALEIRAGFAERNGVRAGDQVRINAPAGI